MVTTTNNQVNLEQVCSLNIEQSRLLQFFDKRKRILAASELVSQRGWGEVGKGVHCTLYRFRLVKLLLSESISVTSPLSERNISLFLIPHLNCFSLDKEKLEKTNTDL